MLKTFAGGRLLGASYGEGAPWILGLPGWTRTHKDFDRVFEGADAIALDLPGFGASPPPPGPWTTTDYAEHVAPVLEELAPRPVVLGHSFGGRVAVQLAAANPDLVGALVLTGAPLVRNPARRRPPAPLYRLGRAAHRAGLVNEAGMERLRQRYGSEDYRQAYGVMREVLVKAVNESYEESLRSYPGPVELVWGSADDQVPVAVAQAALALCAHGTLHIVAGGGHFLPLQDPDVLMVALTRQRPPDADR